MNNTPEKIKKELNADPFMAVCIHSYLRGASFCSGPITWEHAWIYAGRQVQERWSIVPVCYYHHLGPGLDKRFNQYISLLRATPEDLAKYPNKDWDTLLIYLGKLYGKITTKNASIQSAS